MIFANQTYIELLALKPSWYRPLIRLAVKLGLLQRQAQKKTNIYARLLGWIRNNSGPVDWCVRVDNLDARLALWQKLGTEALNCSGVNAGIGNQSSHQIKQLSSCLNPATPA